MGRTVAWMGVPGRREMIGSAGMERAGLPELKQGLGQRVCAPKDSTAGEGTAVSQNRASGQEQLRK